MQAQVFSIISRVMNVPLGDLTLDSSTQTIENWDSLKHINLLLALEEAFGLQFTDEQIMSMISVRAILETLEAVRSAA